MRNFVKGDWRMVNCGSYTHHKRLHLIGKLSESKGKKRSVALTEISSDQIRFADGLQVKVRLLVNRLYFTVKG